jgi:hypothetical protein
VTDEGLDRVRRRYEDPHLWCSYDRWHSLTFLRIKSFLDTVLRNDKIGHQAVTVNLGSGGIDYSVFTRKHIHIDVALTQLRRVRGATAATVDRLPLRDEVADLVICVGEVLNYVCPLATIDEIARIMKPGATLVLEFESSRSLEFIFTKGFGEERLAIDTFFNGGIEAITIYSPDLISDRIAKNLLVTTKCSSFHIMSALALRITKTERFSQLAGYLDPLAQKIPGIRWLGANYILSARKP